MFKCKLDSFKYLSLFISSFTEGRSCAQSLLKLDFIQSRFWFALAVTAKHSCSFQQQRLTDDRLWSANGRSVGPDRGLFIQQSCNATKKRFQKQCKWIASHEKTPASINNGGVCEARAAVDWHDKPARCLNSPGGYTASVISRFLQRI